jgi:hypothetical protein
MAELDDIQGGRVEHEPKSAKLGEAVTNQKRLQYQLEQLQQVFIDSCATTLPVFITYMIRQLSKSLRPQLRCLASLSSKLRCAITCQSLDLSYMHLRRDLGRTCFNSFVDLHGLVLTRCSCSAITAAGIYPTSVSTSLARCVTSSLAPLPASFPHVHQRRMP